MFVMISGACGGLGRAMALDCAQRGYDLFLTDLSQDSLNRLSQGIQRQYRVNIVTKACNLLDDRQVAEMFAYIAGEKIQLDMLLNVAGIDHEGGFTERNCREVTEIVRLNIVATLQLTHYALAHRRPGADFTWSLFPASPRSTPCR